MSQNQLRLLLSDHGWLCYLQLHAKPRDYKFLHVTQLRIKPVLNKSKGICKIFIIDIIKVNLYSTLHPIRYENMITTSVNYDFCITTGPFAQPHDRSCDRLAG